MKNTPGQNNQEERKESCVYVYSNSTNDSVLNWELQDMSLRSLVDAVETKNIQ